MEHTNRDGQPVAIITDIQRYTIHDGPGIRTEFFFKGCPLGCPWCSNPETVRPYPEIGVYPTKCMGNQKCGWCLKECPLGNDSPIAFDADDNLLPVVMRDECKGCYKCVDACPGGGLKLWGKSYTMDEMLKLANQDRSFYERTGGGVTVSGGDVMMQWEFAADFLRECHEQLHINTCMETEVLCPQEHLDAVLAHTDLAIFDIKHIDSAVHKKLCGVPNERILENIAHAAKIGTRIVIRTPVVPGYNDSEENIRGIASFIRDSIGGSLVQWQLLMFRKLGVEKLDSLGREYQMGDYEPPSSEDRQAQLERLRDMVSSEYGIEVAVGSDGKLPL